MEKLISELKEVIKFKDTTEPGDVVLIVSKEPQMLIYAFVASIERDTGKKDEWWNLGLNILSLPIQKMTWTLRTPQMTGKEIFTMGGEERFVKAIDFEEPPKKQLKTENENKTSGFIKRIK